jgi:hypothetical protein
LERARLPTYLYKAAEFSDDGDLQSPRYIGQSIIDTLCEANGNGLWDHVRARTSVRHEEGRPRKDGDWTLLYLSYVMSAQPRLTKFYSDHMHEASSLAGFASRPAYSTTHLRFAELESDECVRALSDAADELVRKAREVFPQIGENIWVDGTAFHSRARLHRLSSEEATYGVARLPLRIEAATDTFLKDIHQTETASPESQELTSDEVAVPAPPQSRFPNVVMAGGAPYGCLDHTAGIRIYRSGGGKTIRCWIGGIDVVAVDVFTGLPLGNTVIRANQQENKAFFVVMRQVRQTLGGYPAAFSADRGFSTYRIYRWSARKRVEPVITFRRPHPSVIDEQDFRSEYFDEHLPRCRHCGGPGTTDGARLGMYERNGGPRLYFRCLLRLAPGCETIQSLDPCAQGYGLRCLTALSPLTERWHALRKTASMLERTHRHSRERYGKSGSDQTGKLKRFGLPAQRLRSEAARFLDWYRFCLRHGIIGSHPRLNPAQVLVHRGDVGLAKLRRLRRQRELDLPYGSAAFEAGYAATSAIHPPLRPAVDPRGSPRDSRAIRNR